MFIDGLLLKVRRPWGSVEHLRCGGGLLHTPGPFLLQEPVSLQRRRGASRVLPASALQPAASGRRRAQSDEGKLKRLPEDAIWRDERHSASPYLIVNERLPAKWPLQRWPHDAPS